VKIKTIRRNNSAELIKSENPGAGAHIGDIYVPNLFCLE
jgi:hypothetical protein